MRKQTYKFEYVPIIFDQTWEVGTTEDVEEKTFIFLVSGSYTVWEPSGRPENGDYDPGAEEIQITGCEILIGKTQKHLPMNNVTTEWVESIVLSCMEDVINYKYQ